MTSEYEVNLKEVSRTSLDVCAGWSSNEASDVLHSCLEILSWPKKCVLPARELVFFRGIGKLWVGVRLES